MKKLTRVQEADMDHVAHMDKETVIETEWQKPIGDTTVQSTTFDLLEVGALFTFHSFSQEVWKKVSTTECLCVSYENEEIDEPYCLGQRVFLYTKEIIVYKETQPVIEPIGVGLLHNFESNDNFQPLSLINALRGYMKETRENTLLTNEDKREGVIIGLAWAMSEITAQATAKDRFIPKK